MESVSRSFRWFYDEFGLASIRATGRNAYLVVAIRTCRTFAYGTSSVIMALFFAELQFTDSQIGLFMSLTLLGDVLLSTLLTLFADQVGRRKILIFGSFLMVLSGAFFAIFENFWLLLFAAVVGVISATGGDIGPFRAVEESILSELTNPSTRSDVLAWYVTISAWGSSLGSEASGRFLDIFQGMTGSNRVVGYHAIFLIYVVMGLFNAALVLFLTDACEAVNNTDKAYAEVPQSEAAQAVEPPEAPSEPNAAGEQQSSEDPERPRPRWRRWFSSLGSALSKISAPTRSVMYKLWTLLAIDALADGMVPYPLTNYYVDTKFHPSVSTLGDVTSIGYFLAAFSSIFAGPMAKRIGLINTMVFTHIPSSAAVLLFPFPNSLWLTIVLFFIRTGLNNMDQAPRAAFIAAVVKPEERTAVMGLTGTLRILAATTGPTLTGIFAGSHRFWIAFVVAGAFRLTYDLGLYALFVNMKLFQHEPDPSIRESMDNGQREIDVELAPSRVSSPVPNGTQKQVNQSLDEIVDGETG